MKSLNTFPKLSSTSFDPSAYGLDVRMQVAAESRYQGDYGIEIELEGRRLPQGYAGAAVNGVTWVYHADGSLRAVGGGAPGGAEYVLSEPCKFEDVQPLVDNLFSAIKSNRGEVVNSTRCSTHVHLNMRGVKVPQLAAFVALWGTFEDVLTNFCGGHRSGNHFALRFSDCAGAVDNWVGAFKMGDFRFRNERRYLALNAACLSTFGSLEVRSGGGVSAADEVVEWVDILHRLRSFALAMANPLEISSAFSGYGPVEYAERVFGRAITTKLMEATTELGEDFNRLVVEGFRRIQPILYTLDWEGVIKESSKVYIKDPFGALKRPAPRPRRNGGLGEFRVRMAAPVAPGEAVEAEDFDLDDEEDEE